MLCVFMCTHCVQIIFCSLQCSVHSFLCKKVLLGATEVGLSTLSLRHPNSLHFQLHHHYIILIISPLQLHPPRDVGRGGFWLDVNSSSLSLSLNVEDPSGGGGLGGDPDSGGLWEMVTVTDQAMKSWRMTS